MSERSLFALMAICLATTAPILTPTLALAQAEAPTPADHPGARLAAALEGIGCSIQEGNTNLILFEAGIQPPEFPMMAVALIEDGYMVLSEAGTLTLINWGACTGDLPLADEAEPETGAEAEPETGTDGETD